MKRVVVTVKREGEARVQDLELPADVPVREWLGHLIEVLGWDTSHSSAGPQGAYHLKAYGPRTPEEGVPIPNDSSLMQSGVRDGFWLVGIPKVVSALPDKRSPELSSRTDEKLEIDWEPIFSEQVKPKVDSGPTEDTAPDWISREIEDLDEDDSNNH